jgi:hypothetical protein
VVSQNENNRMAKDKEVSRGERLERLAHQELRHDTIGSLNAGYAGFQLRRRVKKLGAFLQIFPACAQISLQR